MSKRVFELRKVSFCCFELVYKLLQKFLAVLQKYALMWPNDAPIVVDVLESKTLIYHITCAQSFKDASFSDQTRYSMPKMLGRCSKHHFLPFFNHFGLHKRMEGSWIIIHHSFEETNKNNPNLFKDESSLEKITSLGQPYPRKCVIE